MYERDEPNGPLFTYGYLLERLRYRVAKDRDDKNRAQQVDGLRKAGSKSSGGTVGGAAVDPKPKKKGKQKKAQEQGPAPAIEEKPQQTALSAFTKDDARTRGFCFAFNLGFCSKGKDCKFEHQKAKTRDRSASPGSKGRGKGRDKKGRGKKQGGAAGQQRHCLSG